MTIQLDHYRLLGRSGLRVSPLSLGTMTFGMEGWGTDSSEAKRMLDYYFSLGGNFIDTANYYGAGESERILGALLKHHRQRSVIATKYSLSMSKGDPNACGNHRKNLIQSVEASLNRLQTDYIDLLYLHLWDNRTPVDEILRGLDDLVSSGKVLYLGISDTPAWQISRMQAIADLRGWNPLIALQIPYNLTERTVEREFMPMAEEMGLGILPWSPLAGGVLSGKYKKSDLNTQPSDMTSRKNINIATGRLSSKTLDIADQVVTLSEEMQCTPAQLALAWTLQNPAVTSPIMGARTLDQLKDNIASLNVCFQAQHIEKLNQISAIEPCFPHTMIDTPTSHMMFGGVQVESRNGRRIISR